MSYYVIKGPRDYGEYLGLIGGYTCPQWNSRQHARRFPDRDGAYNWLDQVQKDHASSGSYLGRVVRVNTVADWRAERARLLAEIERLRSLRSAP